MAKVYWHLGTLILIAVAGDCRGQTGDAISALFNKREHIAGLVGDCVRPTYPSYPPIPSRPCWAEDGASLLGAGADNDLPWWRANSDRILTELKELCQLVNLWTVDTTAYVVDTALVGVLITMLSDSVLPHNAGAKTAREILLSYVAWPAIERQGAYLKTMVSASRLSERERVSLLVLSNLTETEERELSTGHRLSLGQRVRMGDIRAEDSLIALYDASESFHHRRTIGMDMALGGSERCLRHLIVRFNDPVYKIRGWAKCTSIRLPILKALQRHHPRESILNGDLMRITEGKSSEDSATVTAYVERFKVWARQTYGVAPERPDPEPQILARACDRCPFMNYEYLPDSLARQADSLARAYAAKGISPRELCQ
jgi:hypothetical protein